VDIVCIALSLYWLVLLARIILSWVQTAGRPPSALGPFIKIVYDLTEPIMAPLRRIIPPLGPIDISPIFVFIILGIVQRSLGCGSIF
jgi:YggT family protein